MRPWQIRLLVFPANPSAFINHSGSAVAMSHRASRALSILLVFLIAYVAPALAETAFDPSLYNADAISMTIAAQGAIGLTGSGRAENLQAIVYYVPEDATTLSTQPEPASRNPLTFSWRTARAGNYPFTYDAAIENRAERAYIRDRIEYPFIVPADLARYMQPQEITDTNQAIKDLTAEIVGSETDAARVVTKLASWVHENIEYNLSSITAEASQSATWTEKNRYGVCDELTSLFISMSREAGIPARFVSGLAYTNLPEFPSNWWAHGWSEVWINGYGWVPVDVTYGQILWTDATHIPFQRSLDAKTDSVAYSVRSNDLTLVPKPLDTVVTVDQQRGTVEEPLDVTITPLYRAVGSKSGNTITATVRNDAPYTIVTDLTIVSTEEMTFLERKKQFLFLPPRSTREVSWRVAFPKLDAGYEYTFPFIVVMGRGNNATTKVSASTRDRMYPLPDEEIIPIGLPIRCEQPPRLYIGESTSVTCTAPEGRVCVSERDCRLQENTLTYTATQAGAFPTHVTVASGRESGATIVTFIVTEKPSPAVSASVTPLTSMHDTGTVTFTVSTEPITDAIVTVTSKYIAHNWPVAQLDSKDFALQFPAELLNAGENTLTITVTGKDKNGATITSNHTIPVTLPATWWDKIQLFVIHLFA